MARLQQTDARWKAGELLSGLGLAEGDWCSLSLSGLALDSREIGPDFLFFATAGQQGHGLDHLQQALDKGAALVLAEPQQVDRKPGATTWPVERIKALGGQVPILAVAKLNQRVSEIAARFYGEPATQMRIAGVTGTNGKTSVSLFLAQALPESWQCAVTGTVGNGFPGRLETSTHTTPDAVQAQRILARLRDAGARAVAMEVSSHALDQCRVAAIPFHSAVFTNLSRDHLDYHGSMRTYAAAKRRLFEQPGLELAVLNTDDEVGVELLDQLRGKVRVVAVHSGGRTRGADEFIRLESLRREEGGLSLSITSSWGQAEIRSRLVGDFSATNLMLVAGVMLAWGIPMEQVLTGLERVETVPGRMQRFGGGGRPVVVVDYAHTPDALQRALTSLRGHTRGRLWVVFGCGGDRDRGKRPQMGRLAEALADRVIVTDDNPRHETSAAIIADILEGMERPGEARVIPNRAEAIGAAIGGAGADDLVLVAGKGHETWQQIGDLRQPFSDVAQVRQWLEAHS